MSKDAIQTPEQQAKADRLAAAKKARRDQDLKWVLSQPEGRRFVWRIMVNNGLFDPIPVGNAALTGQAIGQRTVALTLREAIVDAYKGEDGPRGHEMLALMESDYRAKPEEPA